MVAASGVAGVVALERSISVSADHVAAVGVGAWSGLEATPRITSPWTAVARAIGTSCRERTSTQDSLHGTRQDSSEGGSALKSAISRPS